MLGDLCLRQAIYWFTVSSDQTLIWWKGQMMPLDFSLWTHFSFLKVMPQLPPSILPNIVTLESRFQNVDLGKKWHSFRVFWKLMWNVALWILKIHSFKKWNSSNLMVHVKSTCLSSEVLLYIIPLHLFVYGRGPSYWRVTAQTCRWMAAIPEGHQGDAYWLLCRFFR